MTGDRDKFLKLQKEKDGSVSFENNDLAKIIGKGTVRIENKNTKAENSLLVEYMKHNILSVSQMCDQGHKVTFNSQKCEIRKEGSGKLVATTARASSNIYDLGHTFDSHLKDYVSYLLLVEHFFPFHSYSQFRLCLFQSFWMNHHFQRRLIHLFPLVM